MIIDRDLVIEKINEIEKTPGVNLRVLTNSNKKHEWDKLSLCAGYQAACDDILDIINDMNVSSINNHRKDTTTFVVNNAEIEEFKTDIDVARGYLYDLAEFIDTIKEVVK